MSGRLRMSAATGEVWSGNRRIELTSEETNVLRLLLTAGSRGVTSDSILEAAGRSPHGADPDEARIIIARVRRKAGLLGPSQGVRKERVVMYYFDDAGD